MDFELTSEQKRIQQLARQFSEQEVAPLARDADEKGEFPIHLVKRMGELGFLAGPIEPVYGGSGTDYLSYAVLCEELGRVDSSVRGFLTVHTSLVSLCIRDWGTEEQKLHFLPRLATGEWIGCYALTEPDAGSDAASMVSTATEDGDYYILNGEKIWITNGTSAHLAIIFASRDLSASSGRAGLSRNARCRHRRGRARNDACRLNRGSAHPCRPGKGPRWCSRG